MCQSPSRDLTADSTSLKASLPASALSLNAPRSRQLRQSPFVRRETEWHSEQTCGSSATGDAETVGGGNSIGLTRRSAKGGAEVTDFLVHIRLRLHGLADLFAKEGPVTRSKMVEQALDRGFRHAEP